LPASRDAAAVPDDGRPPPDRPRTPAPAVSGPSPATTVADQRRPESPAEPVPFATLRLARVV